MWTMHVEMQQQAVMQQHRPSLQMLGSPHAAVMHGGHYTQQGQQPPSLVRLPAAASSRNTPPPPPSHYTQYRNM